MKVFSFIALIIILSSCVSANDTVSCLDLHVIKNAPLGFTNKDGQVVGEHFDYLSAIEDDSNICINKFFLPYPRIWSSIKSGKHDGGIVFKSASRSFYVDYVALIRTVKTVVIPAKGIALNGYADLKSIRIGKVRGTHLSRDFDNDKTLSIVEVTTYEQAIKMLKLGRLNAVAGSALVLSYQLTKYNALNIVDISKKVTLGEKEQWLQLTKNSVTSDKIEALRESIIRLKKAGTFDTIMDKYYNSRWREINQ